MVLHAIIVDFTGFFKKSVNFIKCYISLKGEHKGEQILHRKKVIKSTFDNLKKFQKSTNFNEFSRQGTSVSNWYAFFVC